MPPARSDLRLLLFAGGLIVMAGVAVALALLLSTGRSEPPREYEPFKAGPAADLERELREGGPYFIPDPFGGDRSILLALENGEVIALATNQRRLPDCTLKSTGDKDQIACGDQRFRTEELERFEVTIPRAGPDRGVVLVDLRDRLSPPVG